MLQILASVCKEGAGGRCKFGYEPAGDCAEVGRILDCLCDKRYMTKVCAVKDIAEERDCEALTELRECAVGIDEDAVGRCTFEDMK